MPVRLVWSLAHQGMDLASAQLEARLRQRPDTRERLVDINHLDERNRADFGARRPLCR
jgi:hypothetical protein